MNVLRFLVLFETVFTPLVSGNWYPWATNGHFYLISNDALYIGDARQTCINLGGYLAEINDYQEHLFVLNYLTATHYWVGMEYDPTNGWLWTNAQTPADPSIPWNAAASSTDTGVRYYNSPSNGYGLDGRRSPAYYNYICEYGCSSGCQTSIVIQPTQTVVIPQPYTVSCENEVATVENVVTQVVSNDICNTENYAKQTVVQTVIHTVTETLNPAAVTNAVVPVSVPCVNSPRVVTVTSTVSVASLSCGTNGSTSTLSNEDVADIVNKLKVDKKTTNIFRRSLISADDPRPSARIVGSLGIVFFAVMLICIIWVDAINIIRFIQMNCRNHG